MTARAATLSACGRWRYDLTRRWSPGSAALWVGLNPSRADAVADDDTLRRIMAFSRQGGFGAVVVVVAWGATRVFWGREGQRRHQERIDAVLAMLEGKEVRCVGRTRHGQPRHPSRVGATAALEAWTSGGVAMAL